jgi:DNA-binding NarL/FixJ family response regulator
VVERFRRLPGAARSHPGELSPQERRILSLLSRGLSYQAAAGELGVSVNTVRNHVRSIYEKLQVHTSSQAVGRALRAGLI